MRTLQKIRMAMNRFMPKLGMKLLYYRIYGVLPNLTNPKLFNEKLIWLQMNEYGKDPIYTQCADKYRVREVVEKLGYGDLLIPLLGIYKSPRDIDFDSLPDKFVLKWNFGAGFNIICNDKSKLDIDKTINKLEEWGKIKYEYISCERQYTNIPKLIVCKKNIAPNGKAPIDYKFLCFNGKCELGFTVDERDSGRLSIYAFDRNINHCEYEFTRNKADLDTTPPKNFDKDVIKKLISIAEDLSKPFHHVRVDLYYQDGKIYFGEYTFSDSGGLAKKADEVDKRLGRLIDLNSYKQHIQI